MKEFKEQNSGSGQQTLLYSTEKDDTGLSKSLGDHGVGSSMALYHRRTSEPTCITYSGYLLKRSNHPLRLPKPECVSSSKENVTSAESTNEGDVSTKPQHQLVDDQHASVKDRETESYQMEPSETADDDTNASEALSLAAAFFGYDEVDDEFSTPKHISPEYEQASVQVKALNDPRKIDELKISNNLSEEENRNSARVAAAGSERRISAPIAMTGDTTTSHNNNERESAGNTRRFDVLNRSTRVTRRDFSASRNQQQHHPELKSVNGRDGYQRSVSFDPDMQNTSSSNDSLLADFVDPKDGHIWRAKYCILMDGVLYFYRNVLDADSPDAKAERNENSFLNDSPSDSQRSIDLLQDSLSRSPVTRSGLEPMQKKDSFEHDNSFIWEKRVALDNVGAVRSAEEDFGDCSFVLLTADEDSLLGGSDCLVLRASSTEEMQEWLFQFHLSLASYMQQIVKSVGGSGPRISHTDNQLPLIPPMNESCGAIGLQMGYTPHPHHNIASLSHGHGRNNIHRRRIKARTNSSFTTSGDVSPAHSAASWDYGGAVPIAASGDLIKNWKTVKSFSCHAVLKGRGEFATLPLGEKLISPKMQELDSGSKDQSLPQTISTACGAASDNGQISPLSSVYPSKPLLQVEAKEKSQEDQRTKSNKKYVPPHMRRKQENGGSAKYVPPHQRKKGSGGAKYIPPHMRKREKESTSEKKDTTVDEVKGDVSPLAAPEVKMFETTVDDTFEMDSMTDDEVESNQPEIIEKEMEDENQSDTMFLPYLKLGGCADPSVAIGSILDSMYRKRCAKVTQSAAEAYGTFGGGYYVDNVSDGEGSSDSELRSAIRWEVGAVSECGVRNSNEDAYLIANDLASVLADLSSDEGDLSDVAWNCGTKQGLFAIFDGHCGSQAARFATEKLLCYLKESIQQSTQWEGSGDLRKYLSSEKHMERFLLTSIARLDEEFCHLCKKDGRDWDCGATALIAVVMNDSVIVANLGDCRGVVSGSYRISSDESEDDFPFGKEDGWSVLEDDGSDREIRSFWKEVTDTHSPSREDEKQRIEAANGWITTEQEVCFSQLQRMDFCDEDVVGILRRCFSHRFDEAELRRHDSDVVGSGSKKHSHAAPVRLLKISRLCGELAVSRALGDRDFKAAFNDPPQSTEESKDENETDWWEGPNFLPYPRSHNLCFEGDLVSSTPEVQVTKIGRDGVSDEFLLLACDGLWDVMDEDDAIRVARDLLFEKRWSAKKAAARLAELAIHLGSSDNTTVILIRFFRDDDAASGG